MNGHFVRSSTATGYLNGKIVTHGNEFHPDEVGVGNRNLVILSKTTVNKILFEQDGTIQLPWVLNLSETVKQIEHTLKGIIVCAGNFSSVILQRSGIGNPDDLAKAGIETLITAPM